MDDPILGKKIGPTEVDPFSALSSPPCSSLCSTSLVTAFVLAPIPARVHPIHKT